MKAKMNHFLDLVACEIAHRSPRRIRKWAVVDAAVRATNCLEPEKAEAEAHKRNLTFRQLHDAVMQK